MPTMRTDEILAVRASIDVQVDGVTLCNVLERNAKALPDRPALSWKEDGAWRDLSWSEYRDRVAEVAMGLASIGVGRGDFVAIMTRNRPEHVMADFGAMHDGATGVSFYNTLAPEQISYIAGHCEAKVAVLEGREFMKRWEKVKADLPSLERVVLLQDAEEFADYDWVLSWKDLVSRGREALAKGRQEFEATWRSVKPEDPATLIYTSGTTGPPKGVIISQRNVVWTAASLDRTGDYPTGLRAVSYLPLAHALERLATHWLGTWKAAHVYFCPEVLQVFEYLPEVRPQAFAGVPRLWEKLQAGIQAAVAAEPNERKRKIGLHALDVAQRAARLRREAQGVPLGLKLQRALFDRLAYSKIRVKLGLDQCQLAVSGAAPIAPATLEFFAGIGIPIHEGYGMTEDSGPATVNPRGGEKLGTVGPAMPGVEVRLAEDGELLIRGGNVAPGYYRDEERTAETFDPDGWLHTGDIATIDEDGYVSIIDRKKELLITAGGKNISPANLEGLLKQHPLIGQACVVGDRKPYVAALIVLDGEGAPIWAAQNDLPFRGLAEFAGDPRVLAEIQRAVDDANQHLSNAEQIKRFHVLPAEWTVDSEELTPTLKLKRRVVHQKYAEDIERLYA
jgi:long-subunit acyl-CoA synthetase (AMP-forming)